ncbi:hypothetical protein [Methylobacterium sp. 1973]|uniref:hypothetical protein n=1 Tax=Methylobacterium sp. 1973 TaxID=3156421 RepID=UPI00339B4E57
MHTEKVDGPPTKEGCYVARRKNLGIAFLPGWQVVNVRYERGGTADPFVVWQIGDERPWPASLWEFKERIWPGT